MKTAIIAGACLLSALLLAAAPVAAQDAGHALRFDGTTDLAQLHPTGSIMAPSWPTTKTVSLWVNPTGSSSCAPALPTSCDLVFGDRPRAWGISRGVINGQDRLWIWNFDGSFDFVGIEYTVGEWAQIALVHGDGVLSAYKNGVLVGSTPSGPTFVGGSSVLYFGGSIKNASSNWTFEGEIDEVQIWNVALSAAEIAQSMSGPLTGAEPGLAAYYQMSNGSGTSLSDNSGHGWTGTLVDGEGGVPGNGPILWVPSGAFGAEPPAPNTPPNAHPQSASTTEDTPLPVTLSGDDEDEDALTFRVVSAPLHGTLVGTPPQLTYVPAVNYHGTDSFAFVANDGRDDSTPATVSLVIFPVNDPPLAANDTAVTPVDSPMTIAVLANDGDADNDLISISSITQPLHGTASNQVVNVLYTPPAGFAGTDTFTYTIADGQGGFATATVTVSVIAGADPGLALRFDGVSDYVTLAKTVDMLAPTWTTTKTVSLWVKPEGTPYCNNPVPTSCDAIFGDAPRWWGISRGVVGGLDRIWVWNWDGGLQFIGIPYAAGEWLHVALVHGAGVLTAYKNGVAVGSVPSGPTQQPNQVGALPGLQIGGVINNSSRNWSFQGEIDEVQIWNVARTTAEIGQDMGWPLSGAELGLAAYYRMSDGAGTQLTDDSGHGWTGTLRDGKADVPADGPILWVPSGAFSVLPPE